MATLIPMTPLLAPKTGPLKPATPLRPKTAPKTPISPPQRRWRFQLAHFTGPQRRQGFQSDASRHEHRCHRFQTTGPTGLQGQAAVPVGGGWAWPDNEPTVRTTRQYTRPHWCGGRRRDRRAGCGARGRWRGLAGLRADAPSQGLAARTARGRNAAHGHTKQPGPLEQDARRPEHPWGRKQPGPAGRTNHNLRNWAASRPTARSARNAILKSPGHPQCRRRSAPRAHQEKPR